MTAWRSTVYLVGVGCFLVVLVAISWVTAMVKAKEGPASFTSYFAASMLLLGVVVLMMSGALALVWWWTERWGWP